MKRIIIALCCCMLLQSCSSIYDKFFNTVSIDKQVLSNIKVFNPFDCAWGWGDMQALFDLTFELEKESNITEFVEVEDFFRLDDGSSTSWSRFMVVYKFDKYHYLLDNWRQSQWIRNEFVEKCKAEYKKEVPESDVEIVLMNAAVKGQPIYVLAELRFDKNDNFIGYRVEECRGSLNSMIDYISSNYEFND